MGDLMTRLTRLRREILALKTAHKHGLGSMRLFYYSITPSGSAPPSSYRGDISVTIRVDDNSPAYPIILVSKRLNDNMGPEGTNISNGGRLYNLRFLTFGPAVLKIVSTSSLSEITARWEEE